MRTGIGPVRAIRDVILAALAVTIPILNGPRIVWADQRITITEGVLNRNGQALLYVELASSDEAVAAVQFDIRFTGEVLRSSAVLTAVAACAGKELRTVDLGGGVSRVLIYGSNRDPIGEGPIASVSVEMNAETPAGRYPVIAENISAADPTGSSIILASMGGAVIAPGTTPVPVIKGVANAASWLRGGVAPGEIVVVGGDDLAADGLQIAGPDPDGFFPMALGDTRVLFGGIAAPLLYAAPNQLSAVVPYVTERERETAVQVERGGVRSAAVVLPVVPTAPGLFTLDASGTGQGAIVNEDGTINGPSHPASPGSVVLIFATGEGQTSPPGLDGAIVIPDDLRRPLAPVAVFIGGETAELLYAGSAGYQVSGLLQVNVRIPAGLAPNDGAPVILVVGESSSQSSVTIAVR